MVIREAGLLFRDYNLVKANYIQKSRIEIYQVVRKELVSSLLDLVEEVFLTDIIEYLGGKQYIIAFIEDSIMVEDSGEQELLIGYCIVDNKKKINKYINKAVLPLLRKIITEFKIMFKEISISEISQFGVFKDNIDQILGEETKTIDQKIRDSLF